MNGASKTLIFNDCELDLAARELLVGGESRSLEPKTFDLLVYLLENRDRVVSKEELQNAIWPDVVVTEASLTRTIMKARKAVADDAHRQQVIKTLPRRGYRFVAGVESNEMHNRLAEPEGLSAVHFVKSADVHIAYRTLGDGPLDILFAPGFVSHLDMRYRIGLVAGFDAQLANHGRLIAFDKRGVGLSDRIGYPPTIEHTVDDMVAVLDAVGSTQTVLFGVSESGPATALFAATYPERTRAIIMYGAFAKGIRSDDYPWALSREGYDAWLDELIKDWGGAPSIEYFAPSMADNEDFRQGWARYLRAAATPGSIGDILSVLRDIDVRDVLPSIKAPTLILHRKGDRIVQYRAGEDIAERIPGARFKALDGDDHWWFIGDSESILREIDLFLAGLDDASEAAPVDTVLATVMAVQLETDEAAFTQSIRESIEAHRGRVAIEEDGALVATFDGPSRALQCARTLRDRCNSSRIDLHCGLHAGEIERTNGAISGSAVDFARSLMAEAKSGEVITTATLRDLAAGTGLEFKKRPLNITDGAHECFRLVFSG